MRDFGRCWEKWSPNPWTTETLKKEKVISFRKWSFFWICLFVCFGFVVILLRVFCGSKTDSSTSKDFVSWRLRKNLSWGICDSIDQKADDFGGDFSGVVGSRQLGLNIKPGEAFWKQRYMLCSWRSSESVSRCVNRSAPVLPRLGHSHDCQQAELPLDQHSCWNGNTSHIDTTYRNYTFHSSLRAFLGQIISAYLKSFIFLSSSL